MTTLTGPQHAAITNHTQPLIVTAGAGSGKTSVLVRRFLALLEADPTLPLTAIAAITFTEKAAAEMRQRIRLGLADRVRAASDADRPHWRARLDAIDGARIGTIHALCAALLRANAAEAGIDPAFDVLDEIAASLLLDRAIDDALRAPGLVADSAANLLAAYDGGAVREGLRALVLQDVPTERDAAWLVERWYTTWRDGARAPIASLVTAIASSPVVHGDFGLTIPAEDKLGAIWLEASAGLRALLSAPIDWDASPDGYAADWIATLRAIAMSIRSHVGTAGAWGGKDQVAAAREELKALKAAIDSALAPIGPPPDAHDAVIAGLVVDWSRLAAIAAAGYAALKRDRRALDFDDLESRADDLLRDAAVRARVRGEFRFVLVDEFQDTNARQYRIVRALTDDTPAEPAHPGALFVVGDPKQSIYAFRGADVRVFKDVAAGITDRGGAEIVMAESFRTHRPLVDRFNALFGELLTESSAYAVGRGEPMVAQRAAPSDAPPIDLLLTLNPPSRRKDDPPDADAPGPRQREAAAIARHLNDLIAAGRPVWDRAKEVIRPVEYGDMVVLFQAMSHIALYEDALATAGIPYVTVAGRGFFDRQEVWDALNLLRALYSPGDDLALASALRSPLFMVSDEGLLRLRLAHPDLTLRAALDSADVELFDRDDADAVRFARVTLAALGARAGRVGIGDLLRTAYSLTGYPAVLDALPGGKRMRANAEKLIAVADDRRAIALGEFLAALDALRQKEAREGEAMLDAEGAVQLMTVHKSKGLEFPVVVLADTSYRFSPRLDGVVGHDPDAGWWARRYDDETNKYADGFAAARARAENVLREDAEKRRLLYVGATRAADLLVISGRVSANAAGDSLSSDGWLRWLLPMLALTDPAAFTPGEAVVLDTPIGAVSALLIPPDESADDSGDGDAPLVSDAPDPFAALYALTGWDAEPSGRAFAGPPLAADAPHARITARTARDFSATQLADLGAALRAMPVEQRVWFRERWRRTVGQRAPESIPTVIEARERLHARLVGEIVHRALQYGLHDSLPELGRLLADYAWEAGIVDQAESDAIVARALALLRTAQAGEVFAWIAESERAGRRIFRELPFSYQTPDEGRRLHGVIDLLIERADGSWAVVDFKTARVGTIGVPAHAARYTIQVGAYAAAVEALTGATPGVWLYYIHHDALIEVGEPDWRAALDGLESAIGAVF